MCALRTKAMALAADNQALLTEVDRVEMRKPFGLQEDYNPLLLMSPPVRTKLSLTLFSHSSNRSLPFEVLHTLLYGSCKHFLKDIMPVQQKRECASL